MILSVQADDISDGYARVDATWVLPGREEPLDDYLIGTEHSVDTEALKAFPVRTRVSNAPTIFGQAGISDRLQYAVYDRAGLFSAPWVWWLLRSHGCHAVLVEGWADTDSRFDPVVGHAHFQSNGMASDMNADKADVLKALDSDVQILDARPPARFAGTAPEPRPECRAGHIPGSINVPFGSLKSGRHFHSADDLAAIFAEKDVDLSRPIITSCGSGVTASGLAFALTRCGAADVKVYQGSWAEWGVDTGCPIETGS